MKDLTINWNSPLQQVKYRSTKLLKIEELAYKQVCRRHVYGEEVTGIKGFNIEVVKGKQLTVRVL